MNYWSELKRVHSDTIYDIGDDPLQDMPWWAVALLCAGLCIGIFCEFVRRLVRRANTDHWLRKAATVLAMA